MLLCYSWLIQSNTETKFLYKSYPPIATSPTQLWTSKQNLAKAAAAGWLVTRTRSNKAHGEDGIVSHFGITVVRELAQCVKDL